MVREGTRSQTGNARPRVFNTVDTGPTIKRTKPTGAGRKPKASSGPVKSAGKTAGVVKNQKPTKTAGAKAGKAKNTANKLEKKVAGVMSGTSKTAKK